VIGRLINNFNFVGPLAGVGLMIPGFLHIRPLLLSILLALVATTVTITVGGLVQRLQEQARRTVIRVFGITLGTSVSMWWTNHSGQWATSLAFYIAFVLGAVVLSLTTGGKH
jgi:hypothetical protein